METVLTGRADFNARRPTTAVESTPPLSRPPSGTSLIIRRSTASVASIRISSTVSSKSCLSAPLKSGVQYRCRAVFDGATTMLCPDSVEIRRPVPVQSRIRWGYDDAVPGRKFGNLIIDTVGLGHIAQRQEIRGRTGINTLGETWQHLKRLQLRCEAEAESG